MAVSPGLQINIGQQLKLTPQLQQSIKILQYSALEVQQTIQATLETNFMLEVEDELLEDLDNPEEARDNNSLEDLESSTHSADTELKALDINDDTNHADEAYSADYSWDDLYSDRQTTPSSSQAVSSQDSDE